MGDDLSAMARKYGWDDRARSLNIATAPLREEQLRQLERVSARIGQAIVQFFAEHRGCEFHADNLRNYVRVHAGVTAPASADRVMRQLRQQGLIAYQVVSRSKSLYRCGL